MNIEKARAVAKNFLWLDMERHPKFPFVVIHPVFETSAFRGEDGKILDAFENDEKFIEYRKDYEKKIDEVTDFSAFLCWLIRKAYILTFLKFAEEEGAITTKEACKYLVDNWCRIENIGTDVNVSKARIRKWLLQINREEMLEENEYKRYGYLSGEVTLYRGVRSDSKEAIYGFSWTASKKTAEFFADRWGDEGTVYEAKIKKEDIFFTEYGRNEQEYIVDYKKLYDVKKIINTLTIQ